MGQPSGEPGFAPIDVPTSVSSFLMPTSYEIDVRRALVEKILLWKFFGVASMKMLPPHAMVHPRTRNIDANSSACAKPAACARYWA
jgi:hypothetical protein